MAQLPPGAAFGLGAALMLAGAYLRWRLPYDRMTAEERAKEGRMSEVEARRRITLLRFSAPLAVLAGLVISLMVLSR